MLRFAHSSLLLRFFAFLFCLSFALLRSLFALLRFAHNIYMHFSIKWCAFHYKLYINGSQITAFLTIYIFIVHFIPYFIYKLLFSRAIRIFLLLNHSGPYPGYVLCLFLSQLARPRNRVLLLASVLMMVMASGGWQLMNCEMCFDLMVVAFYCEMFWQSIDLMEDVFTYFSFHFQLSANHFIIKSFYKKLAKLSKLILVQHHFHLPNHQFPL